MGMSLLAATVASNGGSPFSGWVPPTRRGLIAMAGQSGAVGTADPAALTGSNAHYANRWPFPYRCNTGNDSDPPTTIDHDWADMSSRLSTTGVQRFGLELSMSRVLEAADPKGYAVLKCARSSTSIGNWIGTWPTLDPDGLSIKQRFIQQLQTAIATYPYDLVAVLWNQIEADAANEASALAWGDNFATFVDYVRGFFPGVPFFYVRLHANASLATMPYRDTARTTQAAAASLRTGLHMIDLDSHELSGDLVHLSAAGYISAGTAIGSQILAAL